MPAIALDPDLAIAHLEYGRMLAWTGRYDEAEEQYSKGIEATPFRSRLDVASAVVITRDGGGRTLRGIEPTRVSLLVILARL